MVTAGARGIHRPCADITTETASARRSGPTTMDAVARYTFGDDDAAIRRLGLVAAAYEPTSRAFLAAHGPADAAVALDLGCGPGCSTALVARSCRPRALVGIDASSRFLAAARSRVPEARFVVHDVTVAPLPGAPADLVFARLLLAHLADPPTVVDGWRRELAPGGTLLLEELEEVEAPPGPLRDYDELSTSVVRAAGGVMCAGPLLAGLGGRRVRITVDDATAAAISLCNVRLWRADGTTPATADELAELEAALAQVAAGEGRGAPLTWVVRQLAVTA
jgi:trans-aconitate 2-methyltransferase